MSSKRGHEAEEGEGRPYGGESVTLPDGTTIPNDGRMREFDDPLPVVLRWLREWVPPRPGTRVMGIRPGPFTGPVGGDPRGLTLAKNEFAVLLEVDDGVLLLPFAITNPMSQGRIHAALDRCVAEHSGPAPGSAPGSGGKKRRRR